MSSSPTVTLPASSSFPRRRAQPGTHIMRRSRTKFAYFFARAPDQAEEVRSTEPGQDQVCPGGHRGRARVPVEQSQLAEGVAPAEPPDDIAADRQLSPGLAGDGVTGA